MRHLNPELQKLEERIVPDLLGVDLGLFLHIGCGCQGGTTASACCNGSSGASNSNGSKSGHSASGSSNS